MEKKSFFLLGIMFLVLTLLGCAEITNKETQEVKKITDNSLLEVEERNKLIIAVTHGYKPMGFLDEDGNLAGFRLDFGNEIGSEMGLEVEFLDIPWSEIFDSIKTGRADIAIASITITEERMEQMLFSVPYYNAGQIMIVRQEENELTKPKDIIDKDRKLGVQEGTTSEKAAKYHNLSQFMVNYKETDDEINDLKNGVVDAVFIDSLEGTIYLKNNPELKVAGEPFTQEYYGIATKFKNKALMNEVNRVIRELKRNGKLKKMLDKWI